MAMHLFPGQRIKLIRANGCITNMHITKEYKLFTDYNNYTDIAMLAKMTVFIPKRTTVLYSQLSRHKYVLGLSHCHVCITNKCCN